MIKIGLRGDGFHNWGSKTTFYNPNGGNSRFSELKMENFIHLLIKDVAILDW